MILIPKARYRVLPRFEDCHHRTFRFFMLRSILYSPDVILPFSHSFLFATITSYASSRRGPVKPLTFPFFASRKEEGTRRRNVTTRRHGRSKYFTVSCSGVWRPTPSFLRALFPRVFFPEQITKNVHAKLIRYVPSPFNERFLLLWSRLGITWPSR